MNLLQSLPHPKGQHGNDRVIGHRVIEDQGPLTLDDPMTRWPDLLQIFTAPNQAKVLNE